MKDIMKSLLDTVGITKNHLTKHGRIPPTIVIEGTRGEDTRLQPHVAEHLKLSILEALGYTMAKDNAVGELVQLFLVAAGRILPEAA